MTTFRLGRVIPVLMALFGLADVGGRFIPIKHFAFRPMEIAQRYPDADGPLEPNVYEHMDHVSGDLSNSANRPELRNFYSQTFTSDALGFHNNPKTQMPGPYNIMVLGDSFAAGTNLNDDETLPAQLQALTGQKVYNGALIKVDLIHILELAERLDMKEGVVIYGFLTRQGVLTRHDAELPGWSFPWVSRHAVAHDWHAIRNAWQGFWKITPLDILARRVMKRFEDGRFFPNPYAELATFTPLQDGTPMLQLPEDVRNFTRPRPMDAAGFEQLAQELNRRHFKLVVLLIPDKYSVYVPLLEKNAGKAVRPNEFLDGIETNLRHSRVPVLNLNPPLRAAAQRAFADHRLIYTLDDTHWNKDGVRIAAGEVAAFLKASGAGRVQ